MQVNLNSVKRVLPQNLNIDMIKPYIASLNNSIPDYIHINKLEYKEDGNIEYIDLMDDLKDKTINDIGSYYKSNKTFFSSLNLEDFIKIWLYVKYKDRKVVPLIILSQIKQKYSTFNESQQSISDSNETFKVKVDMNIEYIKSHLQMLSDIKDIPITEYEIQGENLIYSMPKSNILEVFDNIKLTKIIPFAAAKVFNNVGFLDIIDQRKTDKQSDIQTYYKIYTEPDTDFQPNWTEDEDKFQLNVIKFYINVTKGYKTIYTPAYWNFINNTLEISTESKANITKDNIIEILTKLFNLDKNNFIIKDSKSHGILIIPNLKLNIPILLDLITVNKSVSSLFYMDEHEKTSLDKSRFNIYYKSLNTSLHFSISNRDANEGDYGMKSGDTYTRIEIRDADTNETINKFRDHLTLLIGLYNMEYTKLFKIYEKYVVIEEVTFKTRGRKKIGDTSALSRLHKDAPNTIQDLFKFGYSRKCGKPFQPSYIQINNDEHKESMMAELNRNILVFPANTNNGFYCPQDNAPYIGLTQNKDNPNDLFKIPQNDPQAKSYAPCCRKNEEDANKSINDAYEPKDSKDKTLVRLIQSTSRPMKPGKIAKLPNQVQKLLDACGFSNDIFRFGVSDIGDTDNLLKCINIALALRIEDSNLRNTLRTQLLTKKIFNASIQEFYDYSFEEVLELLNDPKYKLEPTRWIRSLELAFNCNIIALIAQKTNQEEFRFLIPHNALGYLQPPPISSAPLVILLINSSTIELVIEGNYIRNRKFSFDYNSYNSYKSPALNLMNLKIKSNLSMFYPSDKRYKTLNKQPIGQICDDYGKRRALIYKINENKVALYSYPSYPLPLDFYSPNQLNSNCKDVLTLVPKDSFTSILTRKGKKIGYNTEYGMMICNVNSSTTDLKIEEAPSLLYGIKINNKIMKNIHITQNNRKIASFLLQHVIYQLSKHNKVEFTIKPQFKYDLKLFGKNFKDAKKHIYENGKIICSNKTLKNRMLFWAQSIQKIAPSIVENFKDHTIYLDYYNYVSDFKKYNNMRIFSSIEQLSNFINYNNHTFKIWNSKNVDYSAVPPYFKWISPDNIVLIK